MESGEVIDFLWYIYQKRGNYAATIIVNRVANKIQMPHRRERFNERLQILREKIMAKEFLESA